MAMILRITYTPRNSKRAITASVAQPTRVCQSMDMACGSISFKMSMSTMGRAPTTQACSFPWAVREPILACIRSRLRIGAAAGFVGNAHGRGDEHGGLRGHAVVQVAQRLLQRHAQALLAQHQRELLAQRRA